MSVTTPLHDMIRQAYETDEQCSSLLQYRKSKGTDDKLLDRERSSVHHYSHSDGLLYYQVDSQDPVRIIVRRTRIRNSRSRSKLTMSFSVDTSVVRRRTLQ